MGLEIKQANIFHFQRTLGATTYNFSIPADNKESACKLLIDALVVITNELEAQVKAGSKSN